MAMMDMLEREQQAASASANTKENSKNGDHQTEPARLPEDNKSGGISASTSSSASASTSTSAPPKDSGKKPDRRIAGGPSPEKGSGQDRFRQIMAGAPDFPSKSSKGSNALGSTNGLPSRASSTYRRTQPPLVSMPLTGSEPYATNFYAATTGFAPLHSPTMYPQLPGMGMYHEPGHQVAVNPAMFPKFANQTLDVNMPIKAEPGEREFNGASRTSGRDRNGSSMQIRGKGNGGGGSGSDWKPTWTSLLSAECQKRRFNPQFTEWITSDGMYKASVSLNGVTMHDSRNFKCAQDAKQSLAKRALDHVRGLAVPNHPNRASERARYEEEAMNNQMKSDRERERNRDRDRDRGRLTAPKTGVGYDHYRGAGMQPELEPTRGYYSEESIYYPQEDQRLLERVRQLYGNGTGPSDEVLAHPLASRAFLQGFALGGKLQQTTGHRNGEPRRSRTPPNGGYERRGRLRESSPPSSGPRQYRVRSPLRRANSEDYKYRP